MKLSILGLGGMICSCIPINGPIDLYIIKNEAVTTLRYRDDTLRPIGDDILYAADIEDEFLLTDDNGRLHLAHLAHNFLFNEEILE